MSGYLLDTNVISELISPRPDPKVVVAVSLLEDLYLSVVSVHEMTYGVVRLPEGRRRRELTEYVDRMVSEFGDCLLSINETTARLAAELRVAREQSGRPIQLGDALIAGTAGEHRLTVVTRNVSDFEGCGVMIRNPWVS